MTLLTLLITVTFLLLFLGCIWLTLTVAERTELVPDERRRTRSRRRHHRQCDAFDRDRLESTSSTIGCYRSSDEDRLSSLFSTGYTSCTGDRRCGTPVTDCGALPNGARPPTTSWPMGTAPKEQLFALAVPNNPLFAAFGGRGARSSLPICAGD